jgi:hypothetical protein
VFEQGLWAGYVGFVSTTDQRIAETEADPADASGWAVPGVAWPVGDTETAQTVESAGTAEPALDAAGASVSAAERDRISAAEDEEPVDVAAELAAGGHGPGPVHPIVTAMLTCLEALRDVRGVSTTSLTAREIRLMLLAVMQVSAAVFALRLRLLVAGEVQRVQDLTGATTVATFFAHLTRTRLLEARAQARLARDLDRRYPLLLAALEQGLMSPEQVDVAVRALRRLPRKQVGPEQVAACQRFLIDAAQHLAPDQLRVVGKKLWEVIDPDGAERREGEALEDEEQLARAKAYFRSWRNGDGTTSFKGKLPDLQADMLLKVLKAFAAPGRRKNPNITTSQPDDTRHPATAPDGSTDRDQRGDAPTGRASADEEPTADEATGDASAADETAADETADERGSGSSPGADSEERADEPAPEEPDVPYPVRLGHALIEFIERFPVDKIPYAGGTAATIVVTMRLDQLTSGLGVARADTGTEVSAAQVRRLSCSAGLVPMVLGGSGQCLDLGQKARYHTEPMRIAAAVLDQTCALIGCDRPASECDYHHPIPVSEGGDTSLANCAPVCPYHHGLMHSSKWRATWQGRRATLRPVQRQP